MREVSLQEVLDDRERRANMQRSLLAAHQKPLLALNMNIAGPQKRSGLIDFAFERACCEVKSRLGADILREECSRTAAGVSAIWVCDRPASELKELAISIEEERPVGRLYDLDVFDSDGIQLSRSVQRSCLVCGGPAKPCARSRAHGLDAVLNAANALLCEFAAEELSALAVAALIDEVNVTPKPGLVDCRNNGAHSDMDRDMFLRSARCLEPYFKNAVATGMDSQDCMPLLRKAGVEAEERMLCETGGVNTHKGAIYAFGLLLAAMGNTLAQGGDVFETAAKLARDGLTREQASAGAALSIRHGAAGARGEALSGFTNAKMAAQALSQSNGNALFALAKLMCVLEDTNVLHRGGRAGLTFVQQTTKALLDGDEALLAAGMEEFDDECIRRNLSPGGSADMLAIAMFLNSTRCVWENTTGSAQQ